MPIEAILQEVDGLVEAFVQKEPVPGVAYGVLVDGQLIHTRGIGTTRVGEDTAPTPNTVFRIASMTKSFTAATVLQLRDEGLLRLDDLVSSHVPELQAGPPITLRHLLTMSAGFPGDDPWGDRQQDLDLGRFAKFLKGGQSFAWTTDTQFEYSNLGYGILGRVITNVTGLEYRDAVGSRLLQPMGLTSTAYDVDELSTERVATGYVRRDDAFIEEPFAGYGALASMGGLFSSVHDLAAWVDGFARAFGAREPDVDHPLSLASRLEMQQAQRTIEPELRWTSIEALPIAVVSGYGFGLFVQTDLELGKVVSHSGGYPGFGSHMRWHPASSLGVVVLGNRTYFPAAVVGEQMLRALVRGHVAPVHSLRHGQPMEAARSAIERLLASWDDELAAATFSMNVDMDEPMDRRRAGIDRLRETHGALHAYDEPPTSDSPFHLAWWLEGERGHVHVEITLDPQPSPKVQHLELTSVPEPDPRIREAVERLVASADESATAGDLLLVRTLFGPCRLGRAIASDTTGATFRVTAERGELDLTVTIDPETAQLLTVKWTPRPIHPPLFDGPVPPKTEAVRGS